MGGSIKYYYATDIKDSNWILFNPNEMINLPEGFTSDKIVIKAVGIQGTDNSMPQIQEWSLKTNSTKK
ncbi:hypothetical protein D3C71_1878660 [compost metagenome]